MIEFMDHFAFVIAATWHLANVIAFGVFMARRDVRGLLACPLLLTASSALLASTL